MVSIGVILLASAIIGYQLEKRQKSPEGIFSRNYEIMPNTFYSIKEGNKDIMTEAFMAYENKDFVLAAEKLEERIKTSGASELKFYQAMSYGEMGNFPLAIRSLENIKRFNSDYIDECYWYLGLYYIKQGNYQMSIKNFQDFVELTDDPIKKQKAIEIIKRLI